MKNGQPPPRLYVVVSEIQIHASKIHAAYEDRLRAERVARSYNDLYPVANFRVVEYERKKRRSR